MRLISETTRSPIGKSPLAKVDLYLTAWQFLKKSVRGNISGANVLKTHGTAMGTKIYSSFFGQYFHGKDMNRNYKPSH